MFLFDTEFKLMWCLLGLSKVSSQKRFGIICYVTMGIPLGSQIPTQLKELETILIENAFLFTLLSLENHFFHILITKPKIPLFHVISPPIIS